MSAHAARRATSLPNVTTSDGAAVYLGMTRANINLLLHQGRFPEPDWFFARRAGVWLLSTLDVAAERNGWPTDAEGWRSWMEQNRESYYA